MGYTRLAPRGGAEVETTTGSTLHLRLGGGSRQARAAHAARETGSPPSEAAREPATGPPRRAGRPPAAPAEERRQPAPPADERLECAFDQLGASTELLESWQQVEHEMACPARGRCGFRLGLAERRGTLRFMYSLIEQMDMPPQQVWFEAAVLFDAFLRCAPGDTDIGSIPAVAVALVKILKKMDMALLDMSQSGLSGHTWTLAEALRKLGHAVPDATEESIATAELLLLKTLGWRICVPSIQSWTEKFCTRLSVLTRGLPLGPALEWIWQRSYCNAMAIVIHATEQPPRLLAVGLLALGAVEAGLIPLDSVRPGKHEPEAWAQLAGRKLCAGREPTSSGPPEVVSQLVRLLEQAMSTSREEIQDACELVLLTLEAAASAVSTTTKTTVTVTAATTSTTTTTGVRLTAAS